MAAFGLPEFQTRMRAQECCGGHTGTLGPSCDEIGHGTPSDMSYAHVVMRSRLAGWKACACAFAGSGEKVAPHVLEGAGGEVGAGRVEPEAVGAPAEGHEGLHETLPGGVRRVASAAAAVVPHSAASACNPVHHARRLHHLEGPVPCHAPTARAASAGEFTLNTGGGAPQHTTAALAGLHRLPSSRRCAGALLPHRARLHMPLAAAPPQPLPFMHCHNSHSRTGRCHCRPPAAGPPPERTQNHPEVRQTHTLARGRTPGPHRLRCHSVAEGVCGDDHAYRFRLTGVG